MATHASQGDAILTVTNSGPVIVPEQLARPFQRLTSAHNGHAGDRGLGPGLSIVEAIAAALTARPQPGSGLTVQVSFPATRS